LTVTGYRYPDGSGNRQPATGNRQPATGNRPPATGNRPRATMTAIPHTERSFEFQGVVRLTKVGVSFVVFTIVVGFAAINTGNNALYIGLSFMLGCLLLSGVASKTGLHDIEVTFESVREAWAGKPTEGSLKIANRSTVWNVRDLIVTSSELATPVYVPLIRRRTDMRTSAEFLFHRRGIVQLNSIDLYTRYPFGFFCKKRRVKITGEVVVYPRLLNEETAREQFRPVAGENYPSNRIGIGTDVHSFREYVRGDSYRHIYWKKSASLGRFIVKQTETEAARAVAVVVDPWKPRDCTDEDFEFMVSEAATFIFDALKRGLDIMLTMPKARVRSKAGDGQSNLFRALALVDPLHSPISLAVDRNAVVFAVRRADERASA
jgi:uncharacterized protein (DUF58 family)